MRLDEKRYDATYGRAGRWTDRQTDWTDGLVDGQVICKA